MACYGCDKVAFSGSLAASQTVLQGATINFTKNLSIGCTYTDSSITLRKPGLYRVSCNASGATTGTDAANVTIALERNGEEVGKVQSSATSSSSTAYVDVSLEAIVKVDATCCPLNDNSATLTFVNTGAAATFSNMTVTVTRI